MKKTLKTLCLILITIACASSAATAAEQCDEKAAARIYPYPQKACLKAAAAMPALMEIKISPGAEVPADILERYREWLKSNTGAAGSGSIIFEPTVKRHETTYRQEGYDIYIETDPFTIRVRSASEPGFLYALITLRQMTPAAGTIFTGRVEDFPRFSYRGVIEGGYSVWGHQQRLDVIRWMAGSKMNLFMYAPKEGYFFRRRWREPFSKEALAEFKDYVDACKRDRIQFVMALSPALSIEYSNPEEFKLLVAKYRQIQDLGVHDFVIFFDDVLPVMSYPNDRKKYKHIAEAEADVTNRLLAALRERDPKARLAFCPRQYWGWTATNYIKWHREKLNPDIQIGWTGEHIVSKAITTQDARNFAAAWGRPPAIGDNYSPFGPMMNRDPDLYLATDSFINNPYAFADDDEAQLSKFVNATLGDYTWNPEAYEPVRSFTRGAELLAPAPADAQALLFMLALEGKKARSDLLNQIHKSLENGGAVERPHAEALKLIKDSGLLDGFPRASLNPLLAEQLAPMYANAEAKVKQAAESLGALIRNPKDVEAATSLKEALNIK